MLDEKEEEEERRRRTPLNPYLRGTIVPLDITVPLDRKGTSSKGGSVASWLGNLECTRSGPNDCVDPVGRELLPK